MSTVTINKSTVVEIKAARGELRARLEELAEMTRHYPVICTFAGQRWVFESKQDIVDLIDKMGSAIDDFERAA